MSITLEQLIKNRQDLIEAHRKNNFTDGIHALLTDLYPDTAHFIYELLQNAEDMKATVVRFILDKNSIDFEHNGTKRSFNIADIDAITNIGHNSQKKDDPTSIGKFGVGFKAVFAYTSTPIINSGDYHFKIKDYFVPEFRGVEKVSTVDNDGVAWTKFSFPFNNPKKSATDAFDECLDGLKALDSSAVLFLQNIKKIEYMLPSGDLGYVELVDNGNYHVTVTYKKPNESKEYKSRWLRFDRMVDITDDQGNPKTLSTAIAFALEYDEKNKKEYIAPVKGGGRTFIYFPAEKEHSGLRFHINAPFASTVARDSVRNCDDNKKLIKSISQLVNDSLPEIKAQGLMNHSFFEVLPHNKDNLSVFYQYVLDYVYAAFQKNDYLPTKNGGYTSAKNALAGPATISNVLKEADMQALFDVEKTWIMNAAQRNSNVDNFIQSLDVQAFTFKEFARIFESPVRAKAEQLLNTRQSDWLKRFYALCADAYDDLDYSTSNAFVRNMKQSVVIRSSKGEMYRSSDIYILPVNVALITKTTPIVEPTFVLSSTKTDKACEKIRTFFHDELDVREYGPRIEIEKALSRYKNDDWKVDDQYYQDILAFAKYCSQNSDLDFSQYELFLYVDANGDIYSSHAKKLFLGKAYGNENGELLAEALDENCLYNEYAVKYKDKDLQAFVSFVIKCGIKKGLSIVESDSYYHPLRGTELVSHGNYTGKGASQDYTIHKIEKLLQRKSIAINRIIWQILLSEKHGYRYLYALYSPNAHASVARCDSSLIYYLKQNAWIPTKSGELKKPEHIAVDEIRDDFSYDANNPLLSALKFGSAATQEKQKRAKVEAAAEELGMAMISKERLKKLEQYEAMEQRQKVREQLSSEELLKKQGRKTRNSINAGDDFSTDGAVNNVSRRETNVEATFRNAKQMKPAQRKLFGRVVESTKEERSLLRNWYQGKCQMCNTVIIGYNQAPHFIAKNVINTQHLSASIRQTTHLAWNSLCLCPNCAAKYDVCSRDLNGLFEQIMQTEIIEGDPERIVLSIELDGKRQDIRYIPKHFLALKKVMQLIDEETKE